MGSFRGAVVEKVLQRTARMADGWLPQFPPDDEFREVVRRFWNYVDEAGRDRSHVGMDCPINLKKDDTPARWAADIEAFRSLGATYIRVHTQGGGFTSAQEHLDAALRFKQFVDQEGL